MGRRPGIGLILAIALLASGCSGQPAQSGAPGTAVAQGTVAVPAGSPLDVKALTVAGPYGSASVGSDGAFRVAAERGPTEVDVLDASHRIVLMGFVDPATPSSSLSATSTAEVLLFDALGAFTIPGDHFAELVSAVRAAPETAVLATALAPRLAAAPTLVMDGDAAALAAVFAARDAVIKRLAASTSSAAAAPPTGLLAVSHPVPAAQSVVTLAVERRGGGQGRSPQLAAAGSNVVITDPGPRSGVEVLANPNGPGIVAQNSRRRDVALFAYQVASEDANGTRTEIDPPVLVGGAHPVPATRTLNVIVSTLDAFSSSGQSAWAPVLSDPVDLPLVDGSTRTFYEVVAIGPTANPSDVPELFTTSRWFGEVDRWKEAAKDLGWRGFIGEHLLPVMSFTIFGSVHLVSTARLVQFEQGLRTAAESILTKYGITDPIALAARSKVLAGIVEEAGVNASYNRALLDEVAQAVGESELNAERAAAVQARFGVLSKAGLILAIGDAVFSVADIGAVAKDLLESSQAESWHVTAVEAAVRLDPSSGTVTPHSPSAAFAAVVKGEPNGIFVYRWSTTGTFGKVSDYLTDGLSVDSHSDKALYLANDPASITDGLTDTVEVEVFRDDGSGTIPAGATPIGKATATVTGRAQEATPNPGSGDGHGVLERSEGNDPAFNRHIWCATFWMAVPYDPNATDFVVHAFGFNEAVLGYKEQNITLSKAQLAPYPTPLFQGCPSGSLIHGSELWIPLATIESATGPASQADVDEMVHRYDGMVIDLETH